MTPHRPKEDPALASALAGLVGRTPARRGIAIGHRVIMPGDEDRLLPEELAAVSARATHVRRQSGAARAVARELFASLGLGMLAVPRSDTGAPIWPPGVVGSLAHDESIALAAVALSGSVAALGIDVEPALPLPPDIVARVATPSELRRYPARVVESRLLFALKEAVFKALNPLDGRFLDFGDIEIDLDTARGRTRGGEDVGLAWIEAPRIVALAFR